MALNNSLMPLKCQMGNAVVNETLIRCKQFSRPDITHQRELPPKKILCVIFYSGRVCVGFAGNLTEYQIAFIHLSQHESRAQLGIRQIRERKMDGDYFSWFRQSHASSSSGLSQSSRSADSLSKASSLALGVEASSSTVMGIR